MRRLLPFLAWAADLRRGQCLRADILAGITVALVLIPQSMAYAQLAGLPPYYGLYAAFLPPIVAALMGSSRQLATGPVAVVSLLTAAALEPIATAGGEAYIGYAVLLALIVGVFQFMLGLLRLGVLVNFLSHPVVLGFTNAAAIIIATSQLDKIFGVRVDKFEHHYETVWAIVTAAASDAHWPTVGIAVLAFAVMLVLRRIDPRVPGVLIAVALTTVISWATEFDRTREVIPERISEESVRALVQDQLSLREQIRALAGQIADAETKLASARERFGVDDPRTLKALHSLDLLKLRKERRVKSARADLKELRSVHLQFAVPEARDQGGLYLKGLVPQGAAVDDHVWRIRRITETGDVQISAGGEVVGTIPEGLPSFRLPNLTWDGFTQLLAAAVAIALIGFMEAISIAKAMAARTRQRLDPNQELMGQGLSNVVGSMFQSYAVSGSFSRSAVNIEAGAVTGFSSVITGLVVVVTLLFFTPLLYHLPQATLAAVIMMAVIGLVNVRAFRHVWKIQRQDGAVALTTFVLTLLFAPHLDKAILIGVVLSLGLYLYRTMQPRVAVLSRHPDGSLRDAQLHGLETCPNITVIRFDGSLYFANTSYFEDMIMHKLSVKPELKFVIVDAEGINQIDATGEEMLANVTERLAQGGVQVLLARTKTQVMEVLRRGGFVTRFGDERFYRRVEHALDRAWAALGDNHRSTCPLHVAQGAQT